MDYHITPAFKRNQISTVIYVINFIYACDYLYVENMVLIHSFDRNICLSE